MANPANDIKVLRMTNQPDDFPDGGFAIVSADKEYQVTDRLCEECNGTRGKLTHVFRINNMWFEVRGKTMDIKEFAERYPETGAMFIKNMEIGKFTNPTCTACQEDMFMRMKQLLGSDDSEEE